jgi:hypothetical protein
MSQHASRRRHEQKPGNSSAAQLPRFAYGGVVAMDDIFRLDPDRSFERLLLKSAPPGLIPAASLSELP